MGKIVAIGGGEIRTLETLVFDKEIVRLTNKKHPSALFIPTASGDSEGYWNIFRDVYGKRLGCRTDVLYVLKETPSQKEIRNKILSADLIYVGGGNTLRMMRRWRFLGVDKLLKKAYENGTVLSGISAGSICWFEGGHSDSMSFYHPNNWEYIKVKGLGLLKGIHCPHFNGETKGLKRREHFAKMMKKSPEIGIAIDNHCAVEFVDGNFRVLTAMRGVGAYRVFSKENKVIIEEIPKKSVYTPVTELYKKA